MHPRVLIIATTPYSKSDSSRAMDAYFHYWDKSCVSQIFSRNWIPTKGHCGELYQITDSALLRRWLHRVEEIGKVYRYEELSDASGNVVISENKFLKTTYLLGSKHSPLIELMRGMLWRKKYWCTQRLEKWLDEYKPECIVYNFSNHLFTQEIALHVSQKYGIPIVAIIGDDYYFNDSYTLSPFYWLFRKLFKKETRKILTGNRSAVYCSDKIRDKYNSHFGLNGQTIYLTSTVNRRDFSPIKQKNLRALYCGSIRLGRNNALLDIATALEKISPDYKLEVYSNESNKSYYQDLEKHPNIIYGGAIPYSEVLSKIENCDLFVVAEGFRPKDLDFTRYSLSTKAADALASGATILAYGPMDSGVIGYLKNTGAAMVCDDPQNLHSDIQALINDVDLQKAYYNNAVLAYEANHTLERSGKVFEQVLDSVLGVNK